MPVGVSSNRCQADAYLRRRGGRAEHQGQAGSRQERSVDALHGSVLHQNGLALFSAVIMPESDLLRRCCHIWRYPSRAQMCPPRLSVGRDRDGVRGGQGSGSGRAEPVMEEEEGTQEKKGRRDQHKLGRQGSGSEVLTRILGVLSHGTILSMGRGRPRVPVPDGIRNRRSPRAWGPEKDLPSPRLGSIFRAQPPKPIDGV